MASTNLSEIIPRRAAELK
ncbi:hypothetical protein [Escherichia coli]